LLSKKNTFEYPYFWRIFCAQKFGSEFGYRLPFWALHVGKIMADVKVPFFLHYFLTLVCLSILPQLAFPSAWQQRHLVVNLRRKRRALRSWEN